MTELWFNVKSAGGLYVDLALVKSTNAVGVVIML